MSLISRVFERRAVDHSSFNIASDLIAPRSKSGEPVTFDTAIGLAAAWRCITLIGDTLFHLPVDVYARRVDGTKVEVDPPPSLVASPSLLVSPRDWRFQAVVSLAAFGNTVGVVMERDRMLRPTVVEWVNPEDVDIRQDTQLSRPRYFVAGSERRPEEIVHLRRYARPGSVQGMAPLERHRETLGLAIAVRNYAAEWFGSGAHPTGILSTDQPIDQAQAETAKARFLAGVKSRKPVTLGSSWKYEPVQTAPEDSETTQLSGASALAVCQIFGVPPEKVGVASQGSSLTYANRQDRAIDFLTDTILPWLTVFEDFWTANLPNRQFAKFNTGALLRADTLTRYRAHDIGIRAGFKSPNDARRLEDLPEIEDGDVYLWPPYAQSFQNTQEGAQ